MRARGLAASLVSLALIVAACGDSGDGADPSEDGGLSPGADGGSGSSGGGSSSGSSSSGGSSSGGADGSTLADGAPAGDGAAPRDGETPDGEAPPDAGDDGAPPPPPPVLDPNFVFADVNQILLAGQSNAVANSARPILSTTQPFNNLMFNVGVMTSGTCDGSGCKSYQTPTGFVPLVEGDGFFSAGNIVETSSAGFANQATKLARDIYLVGKPAPQDDHVVMASVHGRSGNTYWCLRKGGCNYKPGYNLAFDEAARQMADAHALAVAQNKTHVVRAVWAFHGESDADSICITGDADYNLRHPQACPAYYDPNGEFPLPRTDGQGNLQQYADGLLEWQRDYEAAAKAATGQAQGVPLIVLQYSGWKDTPRNKVPDLQLDAHTRSNGKVILASPGYFIEFLNDYIHYTAESQRRLGEYMAKAYAETVLGGRPWEPLRPTQITRAGNVVTVAFHVPKPPLVLDTNLVTNPGNFGFEFLDDSGATPAITNVALSGNSVVLTLASTPTGGNQRVAYASKTVKGSLQGRTSGPRGNLRDSDPTPSLTGGKFGPTLVNWAVHFERPVQ